MKTESTPDHTIPLHELRAGDADRAGHKAANLGDLATAGFRVPDGFVLDVRAYAAFSGADAMPRELIDCIAARLRGLGASSVAVRSSSVAEDLDGASFAGQYESVLAVRGIDSVVEAVRVCWESAHSERVAAYRKLHDVDGAPMGVLVQEMVDAELSGVAFTANPLTGARDECVINAVSGLGDRLVSGEVSPDEWLVGPDGPAPVETPHGVLDADLATAVAKLARRCADHFGAPQDIEWAYADGELYLLQSRPITGLPVEQVPVPVEVPDGFWEREATHFPKPLCPLFAERFLPMMVDSISRMTEKAGILLETLDHREIGGLVYARAVPPGGKDRTPPPGWMMPLLRRVVPFMRRRIAIATEFVREERARKMAERWFDGEREEYRRRSRVLLDVDLASLSDAEVLQHYEAAWGNMQQALRKHAELTGLGFLVPTYRAMSCCQELLGWDLRQTLKLCTGLSEMSTEPGRALHRLAAMAKDRAAVRSVLESAGPDVAERLRAADPEFADAFDAHLDEWGARAVRYEILDPTIAETPKLVASLVLGQLQRDYDPDAVDAGVSTRRNAARQEARAILADRPEDLARLEKALAGLDAAYPLREDNELFTLSMPLAVLRYAVLELGRRLTARGVVSRRDDVFFLREAELTRGFEDGADFRDVVTERRGQRAWAESADLPLTYGPDPGEPPAADWMPEEPKVVLDALLWGFDHASTPAVEPHPDSTDEELLGSAASPGVYEGRVCIVNDESEFHKVQAGDVLVCPITSPVWSVLFSNVAALVTDTGGTLSHSAIIAREHEIPAVVSTGNATSTLCDGQLVRVDGDAGRVEVLR